MGNFFKYLPLFVITFSNVLLAEIPIIELGDQQSPILIAEHAAYYEDTSANLKIENFLDSTLNISFIKDESTSLNFGYTRSAYWVRFKVINNFPNENPLIILQRYFNVHYLDFYQIVNGKIVKRVLTGAMRPAKSREFIDNRFAFSIIKARESIIYLRYENEASMTINPELMNNISYHKTVHSYNYIFGAFIGILFILMVFNLFVFLALKDINYLYFCLVILLLFLFYFSYSGLAYMSLWPNSEVWNVNSVAIFNNLLVISFLLLTRSFLEIKRNLPLLDKLIMGLLFISILNIIILPFVGFFLVIQISVYTNIILFAVILISGITSYYKGMKQALFFLLSFAGIIYYTIFAVLVRIAVLPSTNTNEYGFMISVGFMFIVLTYTLVSRVTTIKKEREYAARMIQVSEERFKAIVESSNDFIWETDHEGNYTYVSPTVKDMLGYEPIEMLGKKPFDFMPADQTKLIKKEFEKIVKANKPLVNLENKNLTKDGKEIILETSGRPFFDRKNILIGYRGIDRNISERKKAEEALLLSENNFRALLNATSAMAFLMDTAFKIIALNSAFANKYEKKPDELIGKNVFNLLPEKIAKERLLMINTVIKSGKPLRWEDSSPIGYYDNNVYPIFDSNGKVTRLAVYINEITDRKEAEEQIRILSASIEQSPFSIILLSPTGVINFVNKKCSEVTGYPINELIKKRYSRIQPDVPIKEMLNNVLEGKEAKGEYKVSKKSGETYWEAMNLFPIKNIAGKITHIICINEDITQRRELENQLLQSQKMEAIGTLAGGIAHDFNNLLTIIKGYSDLALEKVEDDLLKKALTNIRQASQRAEDLTRQILTFSKKQVFRPEIIDVNTILTNFHRMIPRLIGEDIKLNIKLASELKPIKADPSQFEQIILNLVVNARDAIIDRSDVGFKKQINISTENIWLNKEYVNSHIESVTGEHVCLSVSDTGIGMSKAIQEKIFEPFYTTKKPGKGTGLGLSTVFGIVKQNGGSFYVYSEPMKGTTIKVYWPISEKELTFKEDIHINSEELAGKEKILFVEDNIEILNFANSSLTEFGYEVFSVDSGKKALNLITKNNQKFDLLVSDIVMPDMNGKELADEIVKLIPGIKTLFISGYTDDHIVKGGELSKELNFLEKPFTVSTLLTKIRGILNS